MLSAPQEGVGRLLELVDADAGVRGQDAGRQRRQVGVVAGVVLGDDRTQPGIVALVSRLPRLTILERRVLLRHLLQPAQDEVELDRHRLLAPQRSVVVEHSDALLERHTRWTAPTRSTKSTIACFAGPSVQVDSNSLLISFLLSANPSSGPAFSIRVLSAQVIIPTGRTARRKRSRDCTATPMTH